MHTVESFEDADLRNAFLAEQLRLGRLALVLGSGVSKGLNLPEWSDLVDRLANRIGYDRTTELNNEEVAEELFRKAGGGELEFAELVRSALYEGYDSSMRALQQNELMRGIGAVAMRSSRGSVTQIVSFNFDDLLENYLRYYGYVVESVDVVPSWPSSSDVTVFHPHGLLPVDYSNPVRRPIVMTQDHFDRVVGNSKDIWRSTILNILRTHTCLFLGLSGSDSNLRNMLTEVHEHHVSGLDSDAYSGVRYTLEEDPRSDSWQHRGIYCVSLDSWDVLPETLLEICQLAASGP